MAAPTITVWSPTGALNDPDVDVSFTCDDDVQVLQNTLDLTLTPPGAAAIEVLKDGAWQGVYNGTITAVGNGWKVTLTTHPVFVVGLWEAYCYCEDGGALSASKTWNFTVTADAPTLDTYSPTGTVSEMSQISCRITDDWGFEKTTLAFEAVPPVGPVLTGISSGGFQTGWTGVIVELDDPGTGAREILINFFEWPDLASPQLWTFRVTCETIVGTEL